MSEVPLIAIVDDDADMREALCDLLQVAGFRGRTFASAAQFLEAYAPGRFDLVITDLRMPELDGIGLLRRMRSLGKAPPAIVVTSSSGTDVRARAVAEGAVGCLAKPVDENRLLRLIGRALAGGEGAPA